MYKRQGFNHVVDLIAHEKAAAWLENRQVNPCAVRALFRQGLVQRLGLLVTPGWSQLIIERLCDAVITALLHLRIPGSARIRGWTSRATLAAAATAA